MGIPEPRTRIAAILLGLLLIPLNNYWIMAGATWGSGYPTTFSLFFNVIFFLFFLTLINLGLQRLSLSFGLNPSELLLIYVMLSVASGICGLDMMQVLITFVGGVKWMATPENEWKGLFSRSKVMWIGFAIAGGMDLVNGLHFLYPAVPGFGGRLYDLSLFFTDAPWNAIGWTPIPIFPYAVGLAFFMPLDLSFSCWFFYLFWKGERIFGSILGMHSMPKFPYIEEQTSGAYIGLCVLAIWMTRRHLRRVLIEVFRGRSSRDHSDEPISYRSAVFGLLLGSALLIAFSLKAGMTLRVSLIFFLLYFVLAIGITRMRAELGSPVHDLYQGGAHLMMVNTVGTRHLSAGDLTMFSFYQFFNRAYRGHIMPHQL